MEIVVETVEVNFLITYNALGLEEVADLKQYSSMEAQQFIQSTKVDGSTSPAISLSPCYLLPPSTELQYEVQEKTQKLFERGQNRNYTG